MPELDVPHARELRDIAKALMALAARWHDDDAGPQLEKRCEDLGMGLDNARCCAGIGTPEWRDFCERVGEVSLNGGTDPSGLRQEWGIRAVELLWRESFSGQFQLVKVEKNAWPDTPEQNPAPAKVRRVVERHNGRVDVVAPGHPVFVEAFRDHTENRGLDARQPVRPPASVAVLRHGCQVWADFLEDRAKVLEAHAAKLAGQGAREGGGPAAGFEKSKRQETPLSDDWRDGAWFTANTKVPAARLRQAARSDRKSKRVKTKTFAGVKYYYVPDVRQWWPHDMSK